MGGAKKKSIGQSEKAQQTPADEILEKKGKDTKRKGGREMKRLDWSMPRLSDEEVARILGPLKAITLYEATKVLGVKATVAMAMIKSLENRGMLKKEAGYSGHYVYSLSSIKSGEGK